ncbi:MAG: hypothetical protein AAGB35_07540 [Pseudomonadota bacterium]
MKIFNITLLIFLLGCTAQTLKEQAQSEESVKHPLDGIWNGSFDINKRGPYDFHAIHVNGKSTAVSYKAKAMCSGNIEGNDEDYFADYNLYSLDGAPFDEARITGTLQDGVIESYFRTLSGGDIGKLTMAYNPIYENDSSIELLEGKWSFTDRDGLIIDAEIAEGELSGMDSDNCSYKGRLFVINPSFNAYDVELEISNCHSVDGNYKGLAYIDNDQDQVAIIRMDFVNALYGFHFDLGKVDGPLEQQEI